MTHPWHWIFLVGELLWALGGNAYAKPKCPDCETSWLRESAKKQPTDLSKSSRPAAPTHAVPAAPAVKCPVVKDSLTTRCGCDKCECCQCDPCLPKRVDSLRSELAALSKRVDKPGVLFPWNAVAGGLALCGGVAVILLCLGYGLRRLTCLLLALLLWPGAANAEVRTENFIFTGQPDTTLHALAQRAEQCRRDLAIEWLGKELPRWPQPCVVRISGLAENFSGGGSTSFCFVGGRAEQFDGHWLGSYRALIADVIPHETLHTVLATGLGFQIPRWADEGASTCVETPASQGFQRMTLASALKSERGIPTRQLWAMRQYPSDVVAMYAQGFSQTEFLLLHGDKPKFVEFLRDSHGFGQERSLVENYGIRSLGDFQRLWLSWVHAGSPRAQKTVAAKQCQWNGQRWVCSDTYPNQGQLIAPVPQQRPTPRPAPRPAPQRPPQVVRGERGLPGKDGADGKDGRNGVDGSDGSDADCGPLLARIDSLESELAKLRANQVTMQAVNVAIQEYTHEMRLPIHLTKPNGEQSTRSPRVDGTETYHLNLSELQP